jgi:nucleoside-diphosphate-sugar epimerase
LRPPAIYGHGCPGSFSLLRKLIHNKVPLPLLSTSFSRSFLSIANYSLYVRFFVDAGQAGVFNIADPDLLTLHETFQLVATSLAKPLRLLPPTNPFSLLGFDKILDRTLSSFILNVDLVKEVLPSHLLIPSELAIINAFSIAV